MIKPTILTSGDRALGLGDGFILAPTLLELSETYNVRHIATLQSYNILKYLDNGDNLRIFNMNQQGHFYTNDHIKALDLVYWEVKNSLRQLGSSAVNLTRKLAGLTPRVEPLPDIPIPKDVDDNVKKFFSEFKPPIVVVQPFLSYWNKMITNVKQIAIVDSLIKKKFTVFQIAGIGLPTDYLHPAALNFVGRTSLEQSMAFIKNADVFLGCDSFGQHCAGFMKTPSVVMYVGTSPEDFGYPYASNIFHPEIAFCQGKCGRPMRF